MGCGRCGGGPSGRLSGDRGVVSGAGESRSPPVRADADPSRECGVDCGETEKGIRALRCANLQSTPDLKRCSKNVANCENKEW